MRSRSIGAVVCLALLAGAHARAADPPRRKLLSTDERNAVLTLIKAVDAAQTTDVTSDGLPWINHIFKSANQTAYLPFRLLLAGMADAKSAVVYVRAVSRHDGIRAADERSAAREWLARGEAPPPRIQHTVFVNPGEMPIGGPATTSSRQTVQAPAEASAVLALQQREVERQRQAAEAAKKRAEARRDPFLFPFEDYYVSDTRTARDGRALERAVALPPGEYDVYVAVLDHGRLKTSSPTVVRHTVTVPDYWNDEIALSSLMLASELRPLAKPLPAQQQLEHPYTFGAADINPSSDGRFATTDVLTVVYQICNYGAPDADLAADYDFYRVDDGGRTLFNRTVPQHFGDQDLPTPSPWETMAFATQAVPLRSFPAGKYELEVTVRDRLTRHSAKGTVQFTVEAK